MKHQTLHFLTSLSFEAIFASFVESFLARFQLFCIPIDQPITSGKRSRLIGRIRYFPNPRIVFAICLQCSYIEI